MASTYSRTLLSLLDLGPVVIHLLEGMKTLLFFSSLQPLTYHQLC